MPEKPNKNDVASNLEKQVVLGRVEIKEVPLVISKSPLKKPDIIEGSMLKNKMIGLSILVKSVKNLTLYNSFIITEKKIINPAILTIVFIDDTMEFVNIVTILELGLRLAVEKLVR